MSQDLNWKSRVQELKTCMKILETIEKFNKKFPANSSSNISERENRGLCVKSNVKKTKKDTGVQYIQEWDFD